MSPSRASAIVHVRPCIYDEGHEGPCVGPNGTWWDEVPKPTDGSGTLMVHIGRYLREAEEDAAQETEPRMSERSGDG